MRLGAHLQDLHGRHVDRGSRSHCCAVAQRSRRRGATTSSLHLNLEREADDGASTSTSSHSRSVADVGMLLTLRLLERSFETSLQRRTGSNEERDVWEAAATSFLVTLEDKPQQTKNQAKSPDYYANVGDAIRTLRDDIPSLFERDLNYGIYREDILFKDPRNSFQGMKNYQLIFWSLRFHGRIFFSKLRVEVKRIWQPPTDDGVVKMRWTVHGTPRVPWEAEGTFDGISTYKLDQSGKVYEHVVDNVLLRDPPMLRNPLLAGLHLEALQPSQTPQLGSWFTDERETARAGLHDTALAAGPLSSQEKPTGEGPQTWLASLSTFSWVRLYATLLGSAQLGAMQLAALQLSSAISGAGQASSSAARSCHSAEGSY